MAIAIDVDLLVVGAGPAGLAACLEASDSGHSFRCIEQNSFGGTVYNFPRQKVVMSEPLEIPGVGKRHFRNGKISKEQLLSLWNEVRRKAGILVEERVSFQSLARVSGLFRVKTSIGEISASKVILAMGVRGSPRRLGLPNEDLPKVAYNLVDAEQYQGKRIAVVGGGNAAAEAARMLAEARLGNKVTLLVRTSQLDRCNEENRKAVEKLASDGLMSVLFETSVQSIEAERLMVLERETVTREIENDFLFVFAGAEMPHRFLMDLGVEIDRKFGEPLR